MNKGRIAPLLGSLVLLLLFTTTASAATRAPANTSPPTVSGTPTVGSGLTASTGSWTGSKPIRYAYRWQECDSAGAGCTAIPNATGASYTVAPGDAGHTLTVKVTATNKAGSVSAFSAATGAVPTAATPPPPPPPPPAPASGLHVSGNQLLDANGNLVRLHGVNYSGPEYACIQGWGIFDGPSDDASVTAIKSWNANIVRMGLNEDCVLGINGVQPAYAGANYLGAIKSFVDRLHAQGLLAEISLFWAAPGAQKATDQPPILDADHSGAAWTRIAQTFAGDPKTILNLEGEPHDITWSCWKNGGSACSVGYAALGMQSALDTVRAAGWSGPVSLSGIDYANNLGQWLTYKPTDSLNQLMAEAHVYGKNTCASTACFDTTFAPVAASVPLNFGETGETYDDSSCGSSNTSAFMSWADAHKVGYLAWTWDTWGTCGSLISNFNGTPANAYGTYVKNHYLSLP
jgi:endoglucanase